MRSTSDAYAAGSVYARGGKPRACDSGSPGCDICPRWTYAGEPGRASTYKASEMTLRCDLVVIGAGPHGLLYASWVKQARPQLRVVVVEKAPWHTHKIGESTLSGVCKAFRSVGIRHDAMQRLFFKKNGLGFFYATGARGPLAAGDEYLSEAFDETFQVERRNLDGLLAANAMRLGVEIRYGITVDAAASTFAAGRNVVVVRGPDGVRETIEARLVADASGPSSVLGRHHGGYTTDGAPFQTSSVWGYFRDVKWLAGYPGWSRVTQYPRDEYTQHLCFQEGWAWYIPIVSWQHNSPERLKPLF